MDASIKQTILGYKLDLKEYNILQKAKGGVEGSTKKNESQSQPSLWGYVRSSKSGKSNNNDVEWNRYFKFCAQFNPLPDDDDAHSSDSEQKQDDDLIVSDENDIANLDLLKFWKDDSANLSNSSEDQTFCPRFFMISKKNSYKIGRAMGIKILEEVFP